MNKKKLAIFGAIAVVAVVIVIVLAVTLSDDDDDDKVNVTNSPVGQSTTTTKATTTLAATTTVKPTVKVEADLYDHAAVAADREDCSIIGKNILQKNGSVVDSAVATLFCVGLLNMHSCGIGGGGFMQVYLRNEKKSIIYDFRETAPAASTQDMFLKPNTSSVIGGLAAGIPGNIKGLHHTWQKHGKLNWSDLIEPTVRLAEDGFRFSENLNFFLQQEKDDKLIKDPGFRELLIDPATNTWYKVGDTIKNPKLARTLKIIQQNPMDFYNGSLAAEIVDDLTEHGGIITLDDLKNYKVAEREPLTTTVKGMKYHLMPPPGSGAVVGMALNILQGFNFSPSDVETPEKRIQTFHKYLEAVKFAFARRPLLGDPSFETNVTKVTDAMLNQTFAEILREKIKLNSTYPNQTFYGGFYSQHQDPFGTTHISILAENGDAVAATDTINYGFGGGIRSMRNGIIYNNEMDDFSTPGKQNLWGYLPAPANFIKPGKRPLSSMSPTIVTNADGDVTMIVGASGGSRIITSTAMTLMRKLLLNMELGKAVNDPRVHTHLLPYEVYVTEGFPIETEVEDGLKQLGHKMVKSIKFGTVQAVARDTVSSKIAAKCDARKGGLPAGY